MVMPFVQPSRVEISYLVYGTSMVISRPEKLKVGRFRPFMNFAAVWDNAVMIIGNAIDGSHGT